MFGGLKRLQTIFIGQKKSRVQLEKEPNSQAFKNEKSKLLTIKKMTTILSKST